MNRISRLLTAVTILLSGVLLIPYVTLPAEAFSWQLFANVYEEAVVDVNHSIGKPGSFFKITGSGFPLNSTASIMINGTSLGNLPTDGDGKFEFELNTVLASEGSYVVTASVNPSASVGFALDSTAPNTWPSEGAATQFPVPSGIAYTKFIYMPALFQK